MKPTRTAFRASLTALAVAASSCQGGGAPAGAPDREAGDPERSPAPPPSPDAVANPLEVAGYDLEGRMEIFGIPGVSLAVFEGGRIVWARAYGVVEAGASRRVTPETLFQAASISKPVAALGILRLAEEGRLDLDEDVNRALRRWKVPENELTRREPVTLRRILSHRAGLTVHGFPGYHPGVPLPGLVEILDGQDPANTDAVRVAILPGSTELYSGGGTTVAELLVEDVLERPFPEVMRTRVLEPLGMDRSTFRQPLPQELEDEAARAHGPRGDPVPGGWRVYPERAAAGLWTTASDLARVALAVQRSLQGADGAVLSRESAEAMVTAGQGSFGLGFMAEGEGPEAIFHHSGTNRGYQGLILGYLNTPRGLAVLTNAAGGSLLAQEVARAVAEGRGW